MERKDNLEEKQEKETKVALLGIIVEDKNNIEQANEILHEYSNFIVGRMGIPYHARGISIISVVVDAPENVISALSGKLGKLKGLSVKSMLAKMTQENNKKKEK